MLYEYGEERFAPRIAKAIIATRAIRPIERTSQLTDIITNAVPSFYAHRKTHPATKTFQALRIVVNDELSALSEALNKAFSRLAPGGQMAVIAFQSLEDRIVKRLMNEKILEEKGRRITKKPITPSQEEISMNARSRSAKLRIVEKVVAPQKTI